MNEKTSPAPDGTLNAEIAEDLALLRSFTRDRERLVNRLFGRCTKQSLLRDEVLREIVLCFAENRIGPVACRCRLYPPQKWRLKNPQFAGRERPRRLRDGAA